MVRLHRDRTVTAVAGVVAVALLVRLVGLGARVAQYDEAWLGYWALRAAELGTWEYDPWVHGPFFTHVSRVSFALFGVGDVAWRLPAALLGGLLPAGALLFRSRLRDAEVVLLAGLFAVAPVLVYYSRVGRNDVPLAALATLALGCFLRGHDTGRARHLHAGVTCLALAVTTKESALLYLVAWLGAGALLVDHRLHRAGADGAALVGVAHAWLRAAARGAWRWRHHLALALLEATAVVVFFYAPRAADPGAVGLWNTLSTPALALPVVRAATVGATGRLYEVWVAGGFQEHAYLPYFRDYLHTLLAGAPLVVALAPVGFLVERYRPTPARDLVTFTTYWGGAAVVGYPIANNLPVPWSTVHAAVPLAIPAAVGGGYVYRWLRTSDDTRLDRARRAATATLVAALLVTSAATAVGVAHRQPHDGGHPVVYSNQPPADLAPVLAEVRGALEAANDSTVRFYGEYFRLENDSMAAREARFGRWQRRLPLPWYLAVDGANVTSTTSVDEAAADRPAVIVTRADRRWYLGAHVEGYRLAVSQMTEHDKRTAFFMRRDLLGRRNATRPLPSSADAGNATTTTTAGPPGYGPSSHATSASATATAPFSATGDSPGSRAAASAAASVWTTVMPGTSRAAMRAATPRWQSMNG
jgi:uncharacterized protein (TIGR03663 family)